MAKTKRRNKNRYSQQRVSKRRVFKHRDSGHRVSKRKISKKNNKQSRKIHKRKKMRGGMKDQSRLIRKFMKDTGSNEEQAAIKLSEAEGDIDLAMALFLSEQDKPSEGVPPEKKISPEDAVQILRALIPELNSDLRAITYLTDPRVNFDIQRAVELFNLDPHIGTGVAAPVAPVAPAPAPAPVPAVGPVPNLKNAFPGGGYNVFIAFFRVKGGECQNSPFGGLPSEHITFYQFRVNGSHPHEKRIFKGPKNTHRNIYGAIIEAWIKMTDELEVTDTGIILNRFGNVKLGKHDSIQYEARDDRCWSYFKANLLNHIGEKLGCPLVKGRYMMNTHIADGFKYYGGPDMNAGNYRTNSLMAVVNDHFGKDSWIPHMSTVKSLDEKPLEKYPELINLNPGVDGNGNGWCLRCGIGQGDNIQLL